jgi:hypothetical protein
VFTAKNEHYIYIYIYIYVCVCVCVCVCETLPVAGIGGRYGCETLKIPHCLDKCLTDGGKIVTLTSRPPLYSQETLISFLFLVLSSLRA